LSTGEHAFYYEQFKDIMSYIFKFIEKVTFNSLISKPLY
jgi:hypothetical protein